MLCSFILILPLLIFILIRCFFSTKRPKNFPPGPKWLPLIGNSIELRDKAKALGGQHAVFRKWMQEYNSPVLGIKLGGQKVVVGLTHPIVHEILTNKVYDGRPDNFFLRLRTMGSRMGITTTDGEFWAEQRNFVTKHLRLAGFGRQAMEAQIQNELNELLDYISNLEGKPVWPGEFLAVNAINVLWMFTAGKTYGRFDSRLTHILQLMQQRSKAFDMSGGILNIMPFLRHVAPNKTGFKLIKQLNSKLREFFMTIIQEHKSEYTDEKSSDDLIYAYMKEMKNQEGRSSNFTDLQLIMIILDIFIGGSQTTSITLDLALMLMVIHPKVQERVRNDIDAVLGQDQPSRYSEKNKLSYIEAVLLEVQRFTHIAPLGAPRRVLEETTLAGYVIPKNTTVLIGLDTVLMDKEYWGDPKTFRPERFLDANNAITNIEHFVVFGQGKRRCLGEQLARACLFTFFVGILQKFRLEAPEDGTIPTMEMLPGILLSPKPYNIVFKKR